MYVYGVHQYWWIKWQISVKDLFVVACFQCYFIRLHVSAFGHMLYSLSILLMVSYYQPLPQQQERTRQTKTCFQLCYWMTLYIISGHKGPVIEHCFIYII
jgi:hypothetical protein